MAEKEILFNGLPPQALTEAIQSFYAKNWRRRRDSGAVTIGVESAALIDPTASPIRYGTRAFVSDDGVIEYDRLTGAITAPGRTWTVPAGEEWTLRNLFVNYTASATVGNRIVLVTVTDGTNIVAVFGATTAITAGQIINEDYFPGAAVNVTTSNRTYPLAGLQLPAGYTVNVRDVANVDAADTANLTISHRTVTP